MVVGQDTHRRHVDEHGCGIRAFFLVFWLPGTVSTVTRMESSSSDTTSMGDEGTRRPRDQGTKGPRNHGTKGPEDQGTRGPKNPGTRGRRDQGK